MLTLMTPIEVDDVLRYPPGKSERLAKRGVLPHITLPTGDIRFDRDDIQRIISEGKQEKREAVSA